MAASTPYVLIGHRRTRDAMRTSIRIVFVFAASLSALSAAFAPLASSYAIPKDQQDAKKVYVGNVNAFEAPCEVDMSAVTQEAPEYQRIKKRDIKRGTGEYWILMEKASQRSLRAVTAYAKDAEYDLVASIGYLGSLDPAIDAVDVTDEVIEVLTEDS